VSGVPHAGLGSGAEFDRIRAVWERLGTRAAPSGDDCAIVQIGSEQLAVSTDLAVEGTHFREEWLGHTELGWRVASAALSDLAAVAAVPAGVLASVGVPPGWDERAVADLMDGIGNAAHAVGAMVWGGDLVRSEQLVVDVTVVGIVARPVRRSGAKPGDALWVTGALGGPGAALAAWAAGHEPGVRARERFAHPVPRIAEARWLEAAGARAMIDLSDGLVADAGHLAAASGVACRIDREAVPIHAAAGSEDDALVSGEEYELLVALPAPFGDAEAVEFVEQFAVPFTRIGTVAPGHGVHVFAQGSPVDLPQGFRHFW
jgi:thiamine-monophosphate kinase